MIAKEILRQLGGNKFIAMTGAKQFADTGKGLICKIGRNATGVNYIKIELNGLDLYDMEFIRMRAGKKKIIATVDNVYNDMLQNVFTTHTGMDTHL